MTEYKNLLVQMEQGITIVTINRPKSMNALNSSTVEEMKQVTDNFGKPIRELFKVGNSKDEDKDKGSSGLTEVLFIERCLDLLRDGGRMGIVLPEGVLNSSNLQNAREYFESRAKILLIVSLPQEIFISSGATVKTSLVFLKKFTTEEKTQYESIKEETIKEINFKYEKESIDIKEPLNILNRNIDDLNEAIELLNQEKKKKNDISLTAGFLTASLISGGVVGFLATILGSKMIIGNVEELEQAIEKSKLKIKELQQEKKKLLLQEKDKFNELKIKIDNEIKKQIKQKFDYQIPIADIKKAGINSTGGKEENQLPELLKTYTEYRINNNLWEIVK